MPSSTANTDAKQHGEHPAERRANTDAERGANTDAKQHGEQRCRATGEHPADRRTNTRPIGRRTPMPIGAGNNERVEVRRLSSPIEDARVAFL
jgi:hypothetical protein